MWTAQVFKKRGKSAFAAVLVTMVLCFATLGPAHAIEPVNKTSDGIAIKGYDPVAYFAVGKPVKGNRAFEYEWMDAKWLFSSAAHRELFIKNPEKYAPKYGGY